MRNSEKIIRHFYLTGAEEQISGTASLLSISLGVECHILNPFSVIHLPEKGVLAEAGKAAFSLTVPLGSAMRGWGVDLFRGVTGKKGRTKGRP